MSLGGGELGNGGTVTNRTGGTIAGTVEYGIVLDRGGTVINAGAISGPLDAVPGSAGYVSRAVYDPGASFTGSVDGGNAPVSSVVSTLELASGATSRTAAIRVMISSGW